MDPEAERVLRAYAIAATRKINLPVRSYLDELEAILNVTPSRAREVAETYRRNTYRPTNFQLRQSEGLYLGMYNAVLDTGSPINIGKLRDEIKEKGMIEAIVGGITFKPVKVSTRFGRFKKTFEFTKEYGPKNLRTNVPNSRLSALEFLVKLKKGNKVQGASFTLFNTGRVRFSAGYLDGDQSEPAQMVRYISENYFPIQRGVQIKVNNITSEIKLGVPIDIELLFSLLDVSEGLAKFQGNVLKATFEPERNKFLTKQKKDSPFLYVSFGDKFTLLLSRNGSIIIEGAKDIQEAARITKSFIDVLKETGVLEARRNQRNISISPKMSKLARREDNKPAPSITRRGTTCPPARCPVPYSFQGKCPQGPNYYVRPNPQGQPCCYKIPKRLDYIEKKVEERYNKANVKVPESVRKTFGFGRNTNNKANNVGKAAPKDIRFFYDQSIGKNKKNPVGFKIGSRQCSRYSKVALVDIASRLGMGLPSKVTKPRLCELIQEFVMKKGMLNKNLPIHGANSNLKLGDRICKTYKKSTLIKFASEMGETVDQSMTKEDICKRIERAAKKIRNTASPAAPAKSNSASTAASNLLAQLGGGSAKSNSASNLLAQLGRESAGSNSNENFNYFMNLAKKLKNKNR